MTLISLIVLTTFFGCFALVIRSTDPQRFEMPYEDVNTEEVGYVRSSKDNV